MSIFRRMGLPPLDSRETLRHAVEWDGVYCDVTGRAIEDPGYRCVVRVDHDRFVATCEASVRREWRLKNAFATSCSHRTTAQARV